MIRIILAVIAGYVVWTICWIGSTALLSVLSPDWFGRTHTAFDAAAAAGAPFETPVSMVLIALLTSVVCSLAAGFVAALIAREARRTALILGVLLLLTGLAVEIGYWKYFPIWYHFLFLFGLIPVTMIGARFGHRDSLA